MKFGQYELLEQIAVGGMAEVFKGRVVAAEGFEKLVAIKRILPDLAEDERFVKMLLTEARIHSALSHRNIVQIHDLGISEDGEYFIVLEYVEGYDLRVITEQMQAAGEIIPEALSLHIAAEIAQGLDFAHELRGPDGQPLGLIHRDVTPSNILISFAGEVKLSDFGLAKRRTDRSVVGSLKGNLAYMSPEQAMQAELDRRTDIFSLGAILFELLTGRRLREITDEVAGWSQVASGVVPSARKLRPDLPAAVEHLLVRALAPEPAARFRDASTFGAAIRDVLADLSVAVGASDLASLLGLLTPPRRARTLMMERSKVIRLGPDAQALKEAIAAPATPAPANTRGKTVNLADPGPTPPPKRSVTPARTAATRPAGRPAPAHDPNATPPPTTPLPPARARGYTPFKSSDPQKTPLATPAPRAGPTKLGRAGTNRQHPGAPQWPIPGSSQSTMRGPAPAPAPRRPSPPLPAAAAGPAQPSPARARQSGQRPAVIPGTPAYGLPRPSPPRDFAVAPTIPPPGGVPPGALNSPGMRHRVHRATARIQFRPQRQWSSVFVVFMLLLAAAGAIVHVSVIPLDVLITWRQPTGLSITTDPVGATLRLDGVPLASNAPTTVSVWRDRGNHVIEATHPDYQATRETVRYDKSASLKVVLHLRRASGPVLQAVPSRAAPDAGAPPAP